MRPVTKGAPYLYVNGTLYGLARGGLLARLGKFCSYCERQLATGWEVEHIQPKDIDANAHLESAWSNFLIACKNCNTCKGTKNPALVDWLIPDRDNTFRAFRYLEDGIVEAIPGPFFTQANLTISTLNLNKEIDGVVNEAGILQALDKRAQRMEAWLLAKRWRARWDARPTQDNEDSINDLALATGSFSIWMAAFLGTPAIWGRLIKSFPGTERTCFDVAGTSSNTVHPNPDGLPDGGKC